MCVLLGCIIHEGGNGSSFRPEVCQYLRNGTIADAVINIFNLCSFFFPFPGMPLPIIPSACTSSRPELGASPHHTDHIWLDPSSFNRSFFNSDVFFFLNYVLFLFFAKTFLSLLLCLLGVKLPS